MKRRAGISDVGCLTNQFQYHNSVRLKSRQTESFISTDEKTQNAKLNIKAIMGDEDNAILALEAPKNIDEDVLFEGI